MRFYYDYKFLEFDTLEDFLDYVNKWPELPLDLECYRKFLDDRFHEAEINVKSNPEFSNRDAYELLAYNKINKEN